jgi:hypothetical protein
LFSATSGEKQNAPAVGAQREGKLKHQTAIQEPKPSQWPRLKNMILPSMILSFNRCSVPWIKLNRRQIGFTTLFKGKTKSWVAKS